MKIRNGFVSNSSSSSFIIAANEKDINEEIILTFKIKFKKYVDNKIITIEKLVKHFEEYYGEDFENNTDYKEAKKQLELGKTVYVGSFSNETDDPIETLLCEEGLKDVIDKNSNIVIINSEGGY